MTAAADAEKAPAKVNLTLRVLGRRADGYHEIESLVAFAGVGDAVTFTPGGALALAVGGPTAAAAGDVADNLVLRAARALAGLRRTGRRLGGCGGGVAALGAREPHDARRSPAHAGGAGNRRRRAGVS